MQYQVRTYCRFDAAPNHTCTSCCVFSFSPIGEEGWTEGGAHELLNAVLVRRREVQPPPARIKLVEARSEVGDVFQAQRLQDHRRGGEGEASSYTITENHSNQDPYQTQKTYIYIEAFSPSIFSPDRCCVLLYIPRVRTPYLRQRPARISASPRQTAALLRTVSW